MKLKYLFLSILLTLTFMLPHAEAYVDTNQNVEIVIDAPWRTIRDYVPVLFFTPQFQKDATLEKIELFNYDPKTGEKGRLIFADQRGGVDLIRCAGLNFIDPNGVARGPYEENEKSGHFWHYIARVPVACIGVGEKLASPANITCSAK